MADKRINALANTASSTASDDFIAVDGTTNGTRKLNAFSPSFGGNATVTGTLTAASNFSIASTGFYAGGGTPGAGRFLYSATAGSMLCGQGGSTYDLSLASSTGTTILGVPTGTNNVLIPATTASTTTSTGALVVGNGTSGGLGVGGAIWAGGDITISTNTKAFYNLNYANAKGQQAGFFSRGTDGAWTAGMHFYSSNTDYSASIIHFPGTGDLQFYTNSTSSNYTSSDEALRITPAKQIQVKATTASTGTSSGALVVSGGVGVAGAVYTGGGVVISGSTGVSVIGGRQWSFKANSSGGSPASGCVIRDDSAAADRLTIDINGNTSVLSTTASTTTSSGALVVSGGVGVAGSQYLGVKLNISTHTGDAGGIGFGTETNLYRYQAGGLALDHASGAAPGFLFRENGTSTLRLESNSGVGYLSTLTSANLILRTNATTALTLDTSQNAIFAGTIRTAAPVGGTAASWKLGTVATVSPTSPNRTIEVDIGGTIYYIHAKTTNN